MPERQACISAGATCVVDCMLFVECNVLIRCSWMWCRYWLQSTRVHSQLLRPGYEERPMEGNLKWNRRDALCPGTRLRMLAKTVVVLQKCSSLISSLLQREFIFLLYFLNGCMCSVHELTSPPANPWTERGPAEPSGRLEKMLIFTSLGFWSCASSW